MDRFPEVGSDPFSLAGIDAERAAERIDAWRSGAMARLGELPDVVSPALRERFAELLGAAGVQVDAGPYRVAAFPTASGLAPRLLWRAALVDMLSDIWDVMGEPEFDMEECNYLTHLLTPPSRDGAHACSLCLADAPPASKGASHLHFEVCAVQRAWRS